MRPSTLFALLVSCSLFAAQLFAQLEAGQVTGEVVDRSGAVVVGARVTAASASTGLTRTNATNEKGIYVIPSLPPGPYYIAAQGRGFAPSAKKIDVTVGSRNSLDFVLEIDVQRTTVEVVGTGGVGGNTENQEISQVVSEKQVVELPSLNRNPYDFVATASNLTIDQGVAPGGNGVGYNLNGQRSSSVDVLLDGAQNVNIFNASVGQFTPLDAVQEFRVITNSFGAEYGRATGGIVNVALKPGTNSFHGSVYEFDRVSALASNTFDNNANHIPKDHYTRNQFGYSLGGPIQRNKLFFFSSTEWTRVRSIAHRQTVVLDPALVARGSLLTAPILQAYFTKYSPEGLRPGTQILQQFRVSDLPLPATAPISPGPYVLSLLGNPVIFDRVVYQSNGDVGVGSPQNTWNNVNRIDYNLSSKTTLFAHYAAYHEFDLPGTDSNFGNPSSPYVGYDLKGANFNQNALFSVTHTFTPSLVQTTKVAFNRLHESDPPPPKGIVPGLLISAFGNSFGNYIVTLPGSGPGAGVFGGPQNEFEFTPEVSWTKGSHQLRIGGQYIYQQDNRIFDPFQAAIQYGWWGANNGIGLDNLLQGIVKRYTVAIYPQKLFPCLRNGDGSFNMTDVNGDNCVLNLPVNSPVFARSDRFHDGAIYAQDSWRMPSHFTFNLGVHWEYYGVQHNQDPNLDSNFYFGSGANIFQQVRNGQVFTVPKSPMKGLWKPNKKNVGPRVGFAWDILGDSSTILRGGYGLAYERNYGAVTFGVIQNPPNNATIDIRYGKGQDFPGNIPIQLSNFGPFAGTGSIPFKSPRLRAIDPHIKTAYSHLYSLTLERQLNRNAVMTLGYSGSRLLRAYSIDQLNEWGAGVVYLGTDPVTDSSDRLNRSYSNINFRTNGGFGYYNALIAGLQSNNLLNLGLQLTANYTWAHSIDNLSETFSAEFAANFAGFLDPIHPGLDKGDSDYDVRHRFALSAVWEPHFGPRQRGWVKQVVAGWELTPIFSASTGYPFTAYDCSNQITLNCPRLLPNVPTLGRAISTRTNGPDVGGNTFNYLTLPAYTSYAEPLTRNGALPTCDLGTNGLGDTVSLGHNCHFPTTMWGRNTLRQPGIWKFDMGIYKNFQVTDRFKLQLRSEFYNLFNHSNFYLAQNAFADVSPNASPGLPYIVQGNRGMPYGRGSTGAIERRFVQLGLKLLF